MKVLAIISEYNPFHRGHELHISLARQRSGCDYVLAVMSGNFVQRGEPSLLDKHLRTRMALEHGIDMVIELPVYFATAGAEFFAHNAVKLLNAAGVVTTLAFGSESGDTRRLMDYGKALAHESPAYKEALRESLALGLSYPRAREMALGGLPSAPNDILGLEYLKALIRTGGTIEPLAIPRVGAGYHDNEISGEIASATAIRRAFLTNRLEAVAEAVPRGVYNMLEAAYNSGSYNPGLNAYSDVFAYRLRTADLEGILDISEGLHRRFAEMGGRYREVIRIIEAVKTKRYTRTRLNRAALHILLDIRRDEFNRLNSLAPGYIRVLGMRKTAGPLMRALIAAAKCPVVTYLRPAKKALEPQAWALLEKEIITTDLYYLGQKNKSPVAAGEEFRKAFITP